jgi:hypothetical protein
MGKYDFKPAGQSKLNIDSGDREVAKLRSRANVEAGRPRRLMKTAAMRLAYGGVSYSGNTMQATAGNFYSPELSTDFLERPQSLYEQWNYYRFFYRNNPFVAQAIDIHTILPISRIRLTKPRAKSAALAQQALDWCEAWAKRVKLVTKLVNLVHEYHKIGEVFPFAEDLNPDIPEELLWDEVAIVEDGEDGEGEARIEKRPKADQSAAAAWMKKNYKGFTAIRMLPPENVHMESFPFTDEKLMELVPDAKTRRLVELADAGDLRAQKIVRTMPAEIVDAVREGRNAPLNTDPYAGSFVHYIANKKSDYEARGSSDIERVLPSLIQFDKVRQANASIASRHMTPIRLIYAENMSIADIDALREQVDLALQDPDYSIITNFQVTWEEMGSDQRLLDMSGILDMVNRELYAGFGVTEGLLTGESSYSGDRVPMHVINERYMLLRQVVQDYVDEYLLKPMCARMGFIEDGEDGTEQVIYPRLSFTRLGLVDSQETFDQMFNLYQKGSLDIRTILESLNIDSYAVEQRLKEDMFTVNDSSFNELLRGLYGELGRQAAEQSDALKKALSHMGLKHIPPADDSGRFG